MKSCILICNYIQIENCNFTNAVILYATLCCYESDLEKHEVSVDKEDLLVPCGDETENLKNWLKLNTSFFLLQSVLFKCETIVNFRECFYSYSPELCNM